MQACSCGNCIVRYKHRRQRHDRPDPHDLSGLDRGLRLFQRAAIRRTVTTHSKLEEYEKSGLVVWPQKENGAPNLKYYLDDNKGVPLNDLWDDLQPIQSNSPESSGYPTQKPLQLLDRIIEGSSNEGDIVLDAFCGCGTALVVAQLLKRQWIGIDVSPTACRVMAKRLRKDCHLPENEKQWEAGKGFIVRDLPRTEAELRRIPPFEFENWAVIAIGGIPNKAKVGDMGIDGRMFPISALPEKKGGKQGDMDFMNVWYPIQVKQQDKVGRPDIDKFEAMMIRENRTKGFFVSFAYSSDAMTEIDRFFKQTGKVIIPFTVAEILDEQTARKPA
jgi:DNA methylase